MGVKNLWDILESCKKTLPLHYLQNQRVCVDLSCWMVQLQNVNRSHCPMKDKLYLKGLFHRLRALISLNCSLIFVTDGSIPAIKLSTYRRRLYSGIEIENQAAQNGTNSQKLSSLRRNMGSEFSCMIKEAKSLGLALGIPCLDGIEEAEAQCALLNLESLCDGCFSSDSDIFLFGARTVYRDICLGEGGHVICYEMDDIEQKLGFGRNSLISLALFLGSDYSQGVHGLGPETACQIIKSVGDNDILQKIASEGLSFTRKKKNSMKQGRVKCNDKATTLCHEVNMNGNKNSQGDNQSLQVVEAYMKPKCYSADSDVVHRVLVQHPFQHQLLQLICAQFFEWPPEKTDEYILPKIAERDLRRFANLRSTSSQLGVNIPLKQVPVKCPVSAIIKRRKVHGRECFEVSWEEFVGIKTSVVSADLIESACPEKIREFDDRRALEKKNHRKSRPKKSEKNCSVAEIDLKLQDLLLDIELGCKSSPIASRKVISDKMTIATEVNFINQDPPVILESEGNADSEAAMSCIQIGATALKHEVIDLSSPSPQVHSQNISRFTQMNGQDISVIDLSDSEAERSPEHARKARELRLFLASIRDDIH
ncbi:flap endonuclease GEN-like 2 isoform X2 [Durio zibethinus]|uniref:Single-strand DNA endonuclease 1 n=1 Tax=Durio zibethinus TaxID=66656 RepID=A0A6P6AJ57_DURZI|nr:flap endonuclease GEN-like 2 isoform X2 [Durio zibethinus]